jgi:predicted ATPase
MTIHEIQISGYRSLRKINLQLGALTVLVGANGCGKSNVYQSIQLLANAAHGRFGRRIMEEGGMSSVLWAGSRNKSEEPHLRLSMKFDEFVYTLECGRVPISERPKPHPDSPYADQFDLSMFRDDPDIKLETLQLANGGKATSLLQRKGKSIIARNMDGRNVQYPATIADSESVLSELREPHKFPELSALRMELINWRFYHEFRTDLQSPLRQSQIATLTPIMNDDATDLAAALATIQAVGDSKALVDAIERAFPGSSMSIGCENNELTLYMNVPGVFRPMSGREFSDGTLQYLCLLGALLTPRPAPFMVLNEPETSIHPDLYAPLAELILHASENSQILLTTHSMELANFLKKKGGCSIVELRKEKGATALAGQKIDEDNYETDNEETEERTEKPKAKKPTAKEAKKKPLFNDEEGSEDDDF